jgi:hypothetical protein
MDRFVLRFVASLALVLLAVASARAGDVTASVKGQVLTVKGDGEGADLLLAPPEALSRGASAGVTVQITPQGATTLNGAATPANFDGVVDVKMTLGDSANVVLFQNLSFDGKLTFKGGSGNEALTIQDTGFADDVKLTSGNGAFALTIFAGSALGDDLTIKGGSNDEALSLFGPVGGTMKLSFGAGSSAVTVTGNVGDDFFYKGSAGNDALTVDGSSIGGQAKLKLGSGSNAVTFTTGPIGESLKLKGGSGDDSVSIGQLPIGEDANLNLSAGTNNLTLTDTTVGDDLVVVGKSGDDSVAFAGTVTIGGETKFNLDGGTNTTP